MSDILEKLIKENREAFEEEPLQGHFDRFESKLDQSFRKKKSLEWKNYLQIAASILLVVLVANQVRIYMAPDKEENISLANVGPEYKEVEFYYTSSIESSLKEWNKLVKDGYIGEEEQAMMKQEMTEFDSMYKNLQTELEANPDDERVVNAMLEYYQAKLSIINLIIEKLEQVKQQKLTNDEIKI
ncbi:hypothetical protein ACUNWD_15230 [Sunxiuqinia sp. A32]|uniref:hypothetical protein n=1 Tax=Sunxiuqinia sp. A32 TaxID=3461496 RepID=UPI00404529C1